MAFSFLFFIYLIINSSLPIPPVSGTVTVVFSRFSRQNIKFLIADLIYTFQVSILIPNRSWLHCAIPYLCIAPLPYLLLFPYFFSSKCAFKRHKQLSVILTSLYFSVERVVERFYQLISKVTYSLLSLRFDVSITFTVALCIIYQNSGKCSNVLSTMIGQEMSKHTH